MQKICRTCLNEIVDSNYISIEDDSSSLAIKTKLYQLIPEMVVNQVQNPVMCTTCVKAVNFAYDFKSRCLHVEEVIHMYKNNSNFDSGYVSLPDVTRMSTEIKSLLNEPKLHDITNDMNYRLDDTFQSTQKWCAVFEDQTQVNVKDEIDTFATDLAQQWLEDKCSEVNTDSSLDCNDSSVNLSDDITSTEEKFLQEIDCKIDFEINDVNDLQQNHNVNTYSNQLFSCPTCTYTAPNKTQLKRHITIHTGEKLYACDICKYNAAEKYTLARHIRIVHSGEKPFICSICKFCTSRRCNLIDHLRIHTGEKPFKCNICGHNFTQRSNLTSHMKTHIKKEKSKEKLFACNVCDFRAIRKTGLTFHMRKHAEGNTPVCDICSKTFTCMSSLRLHKTTVHDDGKPFICEICGFHTARKDYMKVHMKIHTGEKPFACMLCEFKATQKSNLKNHINRRHMKKQSTRS